MSNLSEIYVKALMEDQKKEHNGIWNHAELPKYLPLLFDFHLFCYYSHHYTLLLSFVSPHNPTDTLTHTDTQYVSTGSKGVTAMCRPVVVLLAISVVKSLMNKASSVKLSALCVSQLL